MFCLIQIDADVASSIFFMYPLVFHIAVENHLFD